MADVVKVEHGNGDVSLGFESDGVFVPISSIAAHRIEHYKERAQSLADRLEANPDDADALAALDALPVSAKAKSEAKKEGGS